MKALKSSKVSILLTSKLDPTHLYQTKIWTRHIMEISSNTNTVIFMNKNRTSFDQKNKIINRTSFPQLKIKYIILMIYKTRPSWNTMTTMSVNM